MCHRPTPDLTSDIHRLPEYALVGSGRVLTTWTQGDPNVWPITDHFPAGYNPIGDERWLPIVEEAPGYDPDLHWKKVPPVLKIEGDCVVRHFDIVLKMEHA
ncbi:hypothetical protein ABIF64_006615 [Bradyrhizobium japonicum]|uniref:hypothetical protein n=1 Tax=Bradyrhizobium japonicum TaxID=375 RepID=UPI003394D41F